MTAPMGAVSTFKVTGAPSTNETSAGTGKGNVTGDVVGDRVLADLDVDTMSLAALVKFESERKPRDVGAELVVGAEVSKKVEGDKVDALGARVARADGNGVDVVLGRPVGAGLSVKLAREADVGDGVSKIPVLVGVKIGDVAVGCDEDVGTDVTVSPPFAPLSVGMKVV